MFYKVTLLNNSQDTSSAEIVPYNSSGGGMNVLVYSDNSRMKAHLESLLNYEAYILAPGKATGSGAADGVLHLYPGTVDYLEALPEILSWRGYFVEFVNQTHKSLDFLDVDVVLKAAPSGMYTNAQGERIVKVVPQGYIAVHTDGRVVAAGRWLNANIDKEDAEWTLTENPYESMTSEQRASEKDYMDMYLQEYHPGVQDKLYQARQKEDDEFYYETEEYKPQGKKLSEVFQEEAQEPVLLPGDEETKHLPDNVPPGKIMYAVDTGYAVSSEAWPPDLEGYEKMRWYIFDSPDMTDEEKKDYSELLGIDSPQMAVGLDKGPVKLEPNLDVSDAYRLSVPGFGSSDIVINTPQASRIKAEDLSGDQNYREQVKKVSEKLSKIKELTAYVDPETGEVGLSPELDNIELEDLRGAAANFVANPFAHQKAGIMALTEASQYESQGGPKGWHGHFLNWAYGLGKTAIVAASDAILRNRGVFRVGEQATIVTAPNKNIYVWKEEIGKFRDEDAVVIDGDRSTRIDQWEALLARARRNELPSFVIVGSSKFRFTRAEGEVEDPEDAWELGIDAQYMKLMAMGGSSNGREVTGKHISALVIDESGQYVNPDSARHSAVMEISEAVYQGEGLTWTLNGDISGNSSADTISEVSLINKFARDNHMNLVEEYTKTNRDVDTRGNRLGRRVWKDFKRMREFASIFRPQIFSLNSSTVAGDEYGLVRTDDVGSPLGKNWGEVYSRAQGKLVAAAATKKMTKAFGLMQILINSSLGAVHPSRLIEYDLGVEKMISGVRDLLPSDEYADFREKLMQYQKSTSEEYPAIGRVASKMSIADRDRLFNDLFSDSQILAMRRALGSWDAPVIDQFVEGVDAEIAALKPGEATKVGIAGFSKTAIRAIYDRLKDRYQDKVLVQVVDGDTTPEEVNMMQKRHQTEKDRTVVTLVTAAGLYGLSLPSDRSFRLPTWNSAKAGQYEGRFHRSATQNNVVTVAVPDGVCQYMRELEQAKRALEIETKGAVLDINDEGDELDVKNIDTSFIEKLERFRPRILERESGE